MTTDAHVAARTGLVIDRTTHTIRFTRSFDATAAQLFECWTKPEHVSWWWSPSGERLAACEIDLRPGGSFKFVSKAFPDQPFTGVYSEIVPPDRLVFDANGAEGCVSFLRASVNTRMTVEIRCRSAEHLEEFLKIGVDAGTSQTLDNLVAYARKMWANAGA